MPRHERGEQPRSSGLPTFAEDHHDTTVRVNGNPTAVTGRAKLQTGSPENIEYAEGAKWVSGHVNEVPAFDTIAQQQASELAKLPETLALVEKFRCENEQREQGQAVPVVVQPDDVLVETDTHTISRLSNGTIRTDLKCSNKK